MDMVYTYSQLNTYLWGGESEENFAKWETDFISLKQNPDTQAGRWNEPALSTLNCV